jgi:hypothetical protein
MNGKVLEGSVRDVVATVSWKAPRSRFEKKTFRIQFYSVSGTQTSSVYRSLFLQRLQISMKTLQIIEKALENGNIYIDFENTFHVSVCSALRIALCLHL